MIGASGAPPRATAHNALVVTAAALPWQSQERRRLGLPAPPAPRRLAGRESFRAVRLEAVRGRLAALLKRLMSASGGVAEIEPDGRAAGLVVLLAGDGAGFAGFLESAAQGDTALRDAAGEIAEAIERFESRPRFLGLRRGTLPLRPVPLVMGILNVTPDSFSDGGRYLNPRAAVDRALRMAEEGAAIVDIGGESTRPGSLPVPLTEELRRVLPVIEALIPAVRRLGGSRPLLSVDTTKAEVARRAAEAGIDMINDISGLTFDPAMPAVAAETGLPVVISHIRRTPRTMRKAPRYRHLMPEIAAFLRRGIERATRAGVRPERIVVDPGIGFGKRRRDNLVILRQLPVLRSLGRPILIGASRKSFIGGTLDQPVSERLEGSLAAEALAIAGGADIIRAHDVRPAARVARLCAAVLREPPAKR